MNVFVLGFASHPASDKPCDKRLEEMVFDTSTAALNNANVTRQELDHITLATSDELDGRGISSMLLVAPAGGFLKDEIRVTDSGMTGLCLAAMRIASGRFHLGLAASWSKTSIAPVENIMLMRGEPFFTRPVGINAAISDALFAEALVNEHGFTEDDATRVVVRLGERAAKNPRGIVRQATDANTISQSPYVSTPLREGHRAPIGDGATSVVLASEEWLKQHPSAKPLARIAGTGWSTDSYRLDTKRLAGLESFRSSWGQATREAGVKSISDLDAIELDCQTAWHELAYAHALGIEDKEILNPSGSAFAHNPYFCTGMVGFTEAVHQVCGTAGTIQQGSARSGGPARRAAAHGQHGFAQQGNVVAIVEGI